MVLFINAFGGGTTNMAVVTFDLPPPSHTMDKQRGANFYQKLWSVIPIGYATYNKDKIEYDS